MSKISPVNSLEPWDQTDRYRLRWRIRFSEKVGFWAQSETEVIAVCSKSKQSTLNRSVVGYFLFCYSRGPLLPEQAVVTSRAPTMRMETSQLTEDNEDFAGRGRYHQSEVVQGKHFDDDYQSDWDDRPTLVVDVTFSCCDEFDVAAPTECFREEGSCSSGRFADWPTRRRPVSSGTAVISRTGRLAEWSVCGNVWRKHSIGQSVGLWLF